MVYRRARHFPRAALDLTTISITGFEGNSLSLAAAQRVRFQPALLF
jgi:hypothetical protein